MSRLYSTKFIYSFLAIFLLGTSAVAQTEITRYNATEENGHGIVYSLPKTELLVTAVVLERTCTPGELARWSSKYLGSASNLDTKKHYTIHSIQMQVVGVPDTTKRYLITFDRKTVAPFARLAPGNILYAINGNAEPAPIQAPVLPPAMVPDRAMPALPVEYSLATTESKRAEIVASYLYEVREHAMNIVSGSVDNIPKDGESMRLILDKLRTEESRALRLFAGDTTQVAHVYRWTIQPEAADMNGRLLFRFSPDYGVVEADDLSGDPVRLDLKITERAPDLNRKEAERRRRVDGIVYNMPGSAIARITLGDNELLRQRVALTQVGTTQVLAKKMFNLKDGATTAVYLDVNTGALLNVTNE